MLQRLAPAIAAIVVALAALLTHASAASTDAIYLPLLSCQTCTGPSPTPDPSVVGAERLEVIRLVNEARLAAGCPAARVNDALMAGAQAWSVYMDSNGVYYHAPIGWYADYGFPNGGLENIAAVGSAEIAFNAWMASPAHRDNMLDCYRHNPADPSYNPSAIYELGVGHSNGYWTLALGTTIP